MLNTTAYYILMGAVIAVPFYFHHRARSITANEKENTASRLSNVTARLTAFIIAALYTMSFIGIRMRNSGMQEIGFFSCLFSFFALQTQHSRIINRMRKEEIKPEDRLKASIRHLSAFTFVFGLYYLIVELLIPHVGTIPSVLAAVTLITYCIPLLVRISLGARAMHPSELKEMVMNTFQKAGTPVGEVYLIDHQRVRGANAFVCGPKHGFGPFRRSIFVTKSLFEALEPDEIHAVICHEASHFKKNHLVKRGIFSVIGFFIAAMTISFPLIFISTLLQLPSAGRLFVIMVATGCTVVAQLWFLFQVIRKQEFEADLEAVAIGASGSALISALEKLTLKNGTSRKKEPLFVRFIFFNAHPSVEERVEAITDRRMPRDTNPFPSWQLSLTYASFMILSTSLAYLYQQNRTHDQTVQRNIASESTRQKVPTPKNPVKPDTGGTDE